MWGGMFGNHADNPLEEDSQAYKEFQAYMVFNALKERHDAQVAQVAAAQTPLAQQPDSQMRTDTTPRTFSKPSFKDEQPSLRNQPSIPPAEEPAGDEPAVALPADDHQQAADAPPPEETPKQKLHGMEHQHLFLHALSTNNQKLWVANRIFWHP